MPKKHLTPRTPGSISVTPNPSNAPPAKEQVADIDITRKFVRENPQQSLLDPIEERDDTVLIPEATGGELPEDANAALEQREGPPVIESVAPAEPASEHAKPIASPADSAEAQPDSKITPSKEAKVEAPAAEAPVQAAPAAEAPKPSYAPDERIALVDGSDPWTREQIVAGLQERATLQPQAEEAGKFRTLFGYDYQKAEQEWKPVLEILRADPERTKMLDEALHAEPGLLDYLRRSAEFYKSLPPEERGASATAAPQQQAPSHDPRIDKYEKTVSNLQSMLVRQRAQSEWEQVYAKFPSLRHNEKARQALYNAAGVLFTSDERSGKDPLECRGLIDAMNDLTPFLEASEIVANRAAQPVPAAAPAVEPKPGVGAEALLGSNGPGPAGTQSRQPPQAYRGPADDAVAAFTSDFPTGN